jgi:ATP-dependent Clp protease ATP-binding subunit ClpA
LLCLAAWLHKAGRLGTVGGPGALDSLLGWLAAPAGRPAACRPQPCNPPPPSRAPNPSAGQKPKPKPRPKFKKGQIAEELLKTVYGRDNVCGRLDQRLWADQERTTRDKPLVFLFAGPPGTGKNFLAEQLAAVLGREILHLDMELFANPQADLFGSAFGTEGRLTKALKRNPALLVLWDESEKADPAARKNLLPGFSKGFITDISNPDMEKISTAEALFILTTGAAHEKMAEMARGKKPADNPDKAVRDLLLQEGGFTRELLGRFDDILFFFSAQRPRPA